MRRRFSCGVKLTDRQSRRSHPRRQASVLAWAVGPSACNSLMDSTALGGSWDRCRMGQRRQRSALAHPIRMLTGAHIASALPEFSAAWQIVPDQIDDRAALEREAWLLRQHRQDLDKQRCGWRRSQRSSQVLIVRPCAAVPRRVCGPCRAGLESTGRRAQTERRPHGGLTTFIHVVLMDSSRAPTMSSSAAAAPENADQPEEGLPQQRAWMSRRMSFLPPKATWTKRLGGSLRRRSGWM